jgi:signal transduction histidine kinase
LCGERFGEEGSTTSNRLALGVTGPATAARALRSTAAVPYLAKSAAIAVGYFAFTEAGKSLLLKGPAGAFWPSAGLGIAILYLGGLRWWPAILVGDLGSLLADVIQLGVPAGAALAEAAGDLGRTLLSVVVLRRLVGPGIAMDRLRHVGAVLAAVVLGALVSATVAMLALLVGGEIAASGAGVFWRSWWLGDVSGGLVILTLALAWAHPLTPYFRRRLVPEAAIVLAAVIALSAIALSTSDPLTYLVFPALLWAALRLGPQGGTLAVTIAVGIAVWVTSKQLGPFMEHSANDTALDLQLYITIASLTTLYLAAACSEHRSLRTGLALSRARLVAAGDTERRRIERDLHDGAQQSLVALRVKLRLATDLIEQDPELARRKAQELGRMIDGIIEDIRALAAGIYPPVLASSGLAEALASVAQRSPIPATVDAVGVGRCRPEVETAVYFCCSEALQNAAKHAHRATAISIWLRRDGDLRLEVRDDGAGFPPGAVGSGRGLANMRERIESIGGTLDIRSAPGEGVRVVGLVHDP